MSTPTTEALGVFQADLLIRHALLQGIREVRATDWLIDAVMRSLKFDDLTEKNYGQKEIEGFKKWVRGQEIAVVTPGKLDGLRSPCVTIALVSSNEEDNTLADTHYKPQEDALDAAWPNLTEPFTPIFQNATTLVLPASVTIPVFPGMVIVDAAGTPHEILTVTTGNVVTIEDGPKANFNGAVLRGGSPAVIQTLESAKFRETFQIGCHVDGEPLQLIYLHSLVVFILLWGRESLLEGRGFEKSTFSSTDFVREQYYSIETEFNRFISITGTVQHCWPKRRHQKLTGIKIFPKPIGSGNLPSEAGDLDEQMWIGDQDSIG